MDVKIQSEKFDADKKLIGFIEEKVAKLGRFSEEILNAEVILKLDKNYEQGNKVATLKINVAGDDLVAERQCKSFEEAVDQCIDAIRKQLEKYKCKAK